MLPLRLKTRQGLPRKQFTVPIPGQSTRSTRTRRRAHSRTISSLIPKTSRSATDVERSTKHQTAPTKKPSVISVTKRDIWKLFARRSIAKNRDVLPTTLWRGSQKLNLWKRYSVKFLKILVGWMCPSQSRIVSSPWNWTLPLQEILCLCRSGNN